MAKAKHIANVNAGITLALVSIPQCLAYSMLAGLPPIYGLVTATIPALIAVILGKSTTINFGPTNTTGLLILSGITPIIQTQPENLMIAVAWLALLAGLTRLIIIWSKIERIFDFIPEAVVVGFATGAAVMIAVMQIDETMGLTVKGASSLFDEFYSLGTQSLPANQVILTNLGIAFATILIMFFTRKLPKSIPAPLLWLVVLILYTSFSLPGSQYISQFGSSEMSLGWPEFSGPLLNLDIASQMILPAIAIAFIGSLELLVILRREQQVHHFNKELTAQGYANIAGSFIGGFPASTSLTRSALLQALGSNSKLSGIISSLTLLPFIFFADQFIAHIPISAIAGMLIFTAWGMLDFTNIRNMYLGTAGTRVLFLTTFISTLLIAFHEAIILGSFIAMGIFLLSASKPMIYWHNVREDGSTTKTDPSIIAMMQKNERKRLYLAEISGSLFYAAARQLTNLFLKEVPADAKHIVIDLSHCHQLRYSAVFAIENICKQLKTKEITCELINVPNVLLELSQLANISLPLSNTTTNIAITWQSPDKEIKQVKDDYYD